MGIFDRILRRRPTESDISPFLADVVPHQRGDIGPGEADAAVDGSDLGWYAPQDGDTDHFLSPDGVPALHLIPYRADGELVLQLCEDTTGILVSPHDSRLPRVGIYASQLRGQAFHRLGCTAGDFHPGARVLLVREPDNEFDPSAVAVYDETGRHRAGYVNNQKARILARLIDSGEPIEAASVRGTGPGRPCDRVAVLAASPAVLLRLLEPRPADLPTPVHAS